MLRGLLATRLGRVVVRVQARGCGRYVSRLGRVAGPVGVGIAPEDLEGRRRPSARGRLDPGRDNRAVAEVLFLGLRAVIARILLRA